MLHETACKCSAHDCWQEALVAHAPPCKCRQMVQRGQRCAVLQDCLAWQGSMQAVLTVCLPRTVSSAVPFGHQVAHAAACRHTCSTVSARLALTSSGLAGVVASP
jgi:hypothetical protein